MAIEQLVTHEFNLLYNPVMTLAMGLCKGLGMRDTNGVGHCPQLLKFWVTKIQDFRIHFGPELV